MSEGPSNKESDSMEAMLILGALTGLCLLLTGTVVDVSIRTAMAMAEQERDTIVHGAPTRSQN